MNIKWILTHLYHPSFKETVVDCQYADWYDAQQAEESTKHTDAAPITRYWLMALWYMAECYWLQFTCGYLGHSYMCTDFSGEDGYEQLTCTRCGESHDCWHGG